MESSAKKIRVFMGEDYQWYFTPVGGNGEPLVTSEGYTRLDDAAKAAEELLPGVALDINEDDKGKQE